MATKKTTSTKAKTNTKKAAAAKASQKVSTTRAKASKKVVSKTAASQKASSTALSSTATAVSKGKKVKTRTLISQLMGLQMISAGVFVALAIAAGYLIKDTTFNLTLSHLTRDDLASKTSTVFAPAVHSIYDLNLRWVVVGIMALSAVLPLLWAFRWKRQYELNIEAEAMPQRWIDLAVTAGLMLEVIALLSGVRDIMTLQLIGGLMVVTCVLGWLADKQNRLATKPDRTAYGVGLLTGCLPWLLIVVTAASTYFYGMIRSPWYVYVLYGTTLVGFGLIAYIQRQHYRRANQWKFGIIERNYILINIFVKAAFAGVLIVGLLR